MDPGRGKQQNSFRGYKSAFPHNHHHQGNNPHLSLFNNNLSTDYNMFKTSRIQRPELKFHSLTWRKDHYSRGSYRSRFPYRKSNPGNKKSNKSAEDIEEEERKKKLTDTAKTLLNKIKTWNAESNHNESESQEKIFEEGNQNHNEEKVSSEGKPKRIAHSRKVRVKSRMPKTFNQPVKAARYDVNKETVKNFQNRIQHKLIEEIMQMPKENLQNVLNDPKINPIMEVKMSRLVRENKLLIAQKLRTLAESKMKSPGCSASQQLLVDIDKLIDPVIETDLSVLPFELIKQMENVFQVQFDFSPKMEVDSSACESAIDNPITIEEKIPVEAICEQIFNEENGEDLSLYECSTDEDEEVNSFKATDLKLECISSVQGGSNEVEGAESVSEIASQGKNKKRKLSVEVESHLEIKSNLNRGEAEETDKFKSLFPSSLEYAPVENVQNFSSPPIKLTNTASCQTGSDVGDSSTQTENFSSETGHLYGVPLPKEATDTDISSLLEEVNSIQNLSNKLNERRFKIFLHLAKLNPSGNFMSDEVTKNNFIETVSNGDLHLVESLKQFFTNSNNSKWTFHGRKRKNNEKKRKFQENRQKVPGRSPNKAGRLEEKKT